jgi:hypothetical protein
MYKVVLCLLLSINTVVFSQDTTSDPNDLSSLYLTEAFEVLEAKYPVKFFYIKKDMPEEKVQIILSEYPEPRLLNPILNKYGLKAIDYKENLIFIAQTEKLNEEYSPAFYDAITNIDIESQPEEEKENVIIVGAGEDYNSSGMSFLEGYISDLENEEPVIGAIVYFKDSDLRAITDNNGKFELSVPIGRHQILIQSVGYEDLEQAILVKDDGSISLELSKYLMLLDEITIFSEGTDQQLTQAIPGRASLDPKLLSILPSFMGEPDVINSILYLPGVSTIGEGAPGFNVQGGNMDENLLLLGNTMMFNINHVFGFFGAVNSGLIKETTLYKGIIPAYLGGRLSSVLDIKLKDGNTENFTMEGGIGPFTAKISMEIPLKADKSSIIIGGRSSHSDYALQMINVPEIQNSSVFFYDVNLGYMHKFSERTKLTGSLYSSKDDFRLSNEFGFNYGTNSIALNLTNLIKRNWTSYLDVSYAAYKSSKLDLSVDNNAQYNTGINHWKIKEHLTYDYIDRVKLDLGGSAIFYRSKPGSIYPIDDNSNINAESLPEEQGFEGALFVDASLQVNPKITFSVGLRASFFGLLGPGTVNQYENDQYPEEDGITGTENYDKNELISSFFYLEPRSYLRFLLTSTQSLKFGYSRTAQFIYQLFTTDTPFPTDAWRLSNDYLPPQLAHNFYMEYVRKSTNDKWMISLGGYYRSMEDLKDHIDFADLTVNEHLETETILVDGRAYGLETLLNKNTGKLTGSIAYTFSRSERKSGSDYDTFSINNGDWYLSNYDKPHELNLFLNYAFNKRHNFSITFNYATGRPVTAPIGYYDVAEGSRVPIYSNRNELRIPDYHRLDIVYTLGQGHRRNKKWRSSWAFGIYNVYGRENAYSVYFTQAPYSAVQANKFSILGSAFPAITYNFKFTGK